MKQKLKYLYSTLLLFLFTGSLFAEVDPTDDLGGGLEGTPPPPGGSNQASESEGSLSVPIDMYEGLLLVVAVMFIVGMYYYNKRRKLA